MKIEQEVREKKEELILEIEKLFQNSLRDVKLQVLLRQDQVKDRKQAASKTIKEIDCTITLMQKQMSNWDKRHFVQRSFAEVSTQAEQILSQLQVKDILQVESDATVR